MLGDARTRLDKWDTQSTVVVLEWNSSAIAVLLGHNAELVLERQLPAAPCDSMTEGEAVGEFFRSVICLAQPHRVAAIVIITPLETNFPDSLHAPAGFPVPVVVVPAWRAVAQFWGRHFKTFAVLDSRGPGALRVLHRSNRSELEPIGPCNSLAALVDSDRGASLSGSDDVLLRLVSQRGGPVSATGSDGSSGPALLPGTTRKRLSGVADALAAILEPALRIIDLSAVVCTGKFFETFGDAFRREIMRALSRRSPRTPEIVAADGRMVCLPGAWELARNVTERPGVRVSMSDTAARLEIIALHEVRYSTLHPQGYVFDPDNPAVAEAVGRRPLLVAVDPHVERLYGADLHNHLDSRTNCRGYVTIDGCERAKRWEQVQRLCDEAIRLGLPRDGVIVGIGGGVTLDIAGFAASIFRRGVGYVRIPTSLVGLVDVGVGIKQSINAGDKKTILGSFYPAVTNINDPTFLSTLPERYLACGIAEIIKMAVVRDEDLFATLETHVPELLARHFQGPAAARQILVRAEYLMMRELQGNLFEADRRRLPDFGHTFSPIIETASLYSIAHGEAVAIDMLLSTAIAVNRGLCERETLERLRSLLIAADLPLAQDVCDADLLMEGLQSARAHRGGELNLVVPLRLGGAGFIQQVSRRELEEALESSCLICRQAFTAETQSTPRFHGERCF